MATHPIPRPSYTSRHCPHNVIYNDDLSASNNTHADLPTTQIDPYLLNPRFSHPQHVEAVHIVPVQTGSSILVQSSELHYGRSVSKAQSEVALTLYRGLLSSTFKERALHVNV